MPTIWETNSEILGMKIGYEHQILQKSHPYRFKKR